MTGEQQQKNHSHHLVTADLSTFLFDAHQLGNKTCPAMRGDYERYHAKQEARQANQQDPCQHELWQADFSNKAPGKRKQRSPRQASSQTSSIQLSNLRANEKPGKRRSVKGPARCLPRARVRHRTERRRPQELPLQLAADAVDQTGADRVAGIAR